MPEDLHKELQNLFSWKQFYQWQYNTAKAKEIQQKIDVVQHLIDTSENFIKKDSFNIKK